MNLELQEDQSILKKLVVNFVNKNVMPFRKLLGTDIKLMDELYEKIMSFDIYSLLNPENKSDYESPLQDIIIIAKELSSADVWLSYNTFKAMLPLFILQEFYENNDVKLLFKNIIKMPMLYRFATVLTIEDDQHIIERGGFEYLSLDSDPVLYGTEFDFIVIITKNDRSNSLYLLHKSDAKDVDRIRVEDAISDKTRLGRLLFKNFKLPKKISGNTDKIKHSLESARVKMIIILCAILTGVSNSAYHESFQYAKLRKTFGKLIYQHQAVAIRIAEIITNIEIMKNLCWDISSRIDKKQNVKIAEAMDILKYMNSLSLEIIAKSSKILGGHGYVSDNLFEKWYRDVLQINMISNCFI